MVGTIEEKTSVFELDDILQEKINKEIILALFKMLHKKSYITKKEYDALEKGVNRTFNINA